MDVLSCSVPLELVDKRSLSWSSAGPAIQFPAIFSVVTSSCLLRRIHGQMRGGSVPVWRRDVEIGLLNYSVIEKR